MNKKILIAILSVFILGLISTSSALVTLSYGDLENDNNFEEIVSNRSEIKYCLVSIAGEGEVSFEKIFAFRKDLSYFYEIGITSVFEIFTGRFYEFDHEFGSGELTFFTGFVSQDEYSFRLIGYARCLST
jgi:hypothetical protein